MKEELSIIETPYGLIASLDKDIFIPVSSLRALATQEYGEVIHNAHNIIIQCLLGELLEQRTINIFDKLPSHLAEHLMGYLHDCCSLATDVCRRFWSEIERYKITDILPSDVILQKYMAHLDGKPVEQHVLDEIKAYDERLKQRLDDNGEVKDKELAGRVAMYNELVDIGAYDDILSNLPAAAKIPPFPLLEMYWVIIPKLNKALDEKPRALVFNFVRKLGEQINKNKAIASDEETLPPPDRLLLSIESKHSFDYVVTDKQFMGLVNTLKKDLDAGSKHLIEASGKFY